MALQRFPFGDFLNQGYREEIQTTFIETTPDAGTPLRRQTNTDANKFVEGSKLFTDIDKNLFMDFFQNSTQSGSLPFEIFDCINNIYRTARFVEKPQVIRLSNRWSVTYKFILDPVRIQQELFLTTENGLLLSTEDDKLLVGEVNINV